MLVFCVFVIVHCSICYDGIMHKVICKPNSSLYLLSVFKYKKGLKSSYQNMRLEHILECLFSWYQKTFSSCMQLASLRYLALGIFFFFLIVLQESIVCVLFLSFCFYKSHTHTYQLILFVLNNLLRKYMLFSLNFSYFINYHSSNCSLLLIPKANNWRF